VAMLKPVAHADLMCEGPHAGRVLPIRCTAPAYTVLHRGVSVAEALEKVDSCGLRYPLLAKPFLTDGREGSHQLALVNSAPGLQQLVTGSAPAPHLPVLLQQYVDHGACLFKIYVLGEEHVAVKRPSLCLCQPAVEQGNGGRGSVPDIIPCSTPPAEAGQCPDVAEGVGAGPVRAVDLEVMRRVSAYPAGVQWGTLDLAPQGHNVPEPPGWLWEAIAAHLRSRLSLQLFNFDVIVPLRPPQRQGGLLPGGVGTAEEGLVQLIDVNYFPGYEKLPGYEELMVRFLERQFPGR
jgi:inositol-1,3,4-trisphosphate 5/6-kinase/inositol-tetrakisphosphate 1-kinase